MIRQTKYLLSADEEMSTLWEHRAIGYVNTVPMDAEDYLRLAQEAERVIYDALNRAKED